MGEDESLRCQCGATFMPNPILAQRLVWCTRCHQFVILSATASDQARLAVFEFKTPHLSFVPAQKRDWKQLRDVYADPQNLKFETSMPSTPRQVKAKLKLVALPHGFRRSNMLIYKVSRQSDDIAIELVSVLFEQPYLSAELGIAIHHPYRRQGYGTEMVAGMVNFLFNEFNVHKISAACDAKNEACMALFNRVGFHQEGLLEDHCYHPERGWIDGPRYAIFHPKRGE